MTVLILTATLPAISLYNFRSMVKVSTLRYTLTIYIQQVIFRAPSVVIHCTTEGPTVVFNVRAGDREEVVVSGSNFICYPLALLVCRTGKRDDYIILSPSNISGWTST